MSALKDLLLFFLFFFAITKLHAAPIFWTARDIDGENGFGDASVSTTGTLIEAANFGGSAVTSPTINTVPFTGIDFTNGESPTSLSGLTYNNSESGSGVSGIGEIDPLLEEIALLRNRGVQNTTLTGLVVGKRYEVQFFISYNINRTYSFNDLEGNTVSIGVVNPARFVTGTFFADAETQDIEMRSSTGSHFLNGYQLRELPPDIEVTTLTDELNDPRGAEVSLREAIRDLGERGVIAFNHALDGGLIQLDASLGQLIIDKSLTIDASTLPNGIIIDGGSNGDFEFDVDETRCFLITDNNDNNQLEVTLNQLIIRNGVFEGELAGGNIHNRENLTLNDCQILSGRSFGGIGEVGANGGGIYSRSGNLTLSNCTISGNETEARNSEGGGIYSIAGDLTLSNCTVSENQTHGDSAPGGGIYSSQGDLTLSNCTVLENRTHGNLAHGGGIFTSFGDLTLSNCTVSGNQTQGDSAAGGGIYRTFSHSNQTSRLTRCTIVGNSALNGTGGGIFNRSIMIIEHCTIAENSAPSGEGAGIASFGDSGFGSTSNSTQIVHSIVRDNNGGLDLALFVSSGTELNTYTFSGENLIGTVEAGIDNVPLNTEPILLAPLANYGGPTETMPPLPGSPAIDGATTSTATVDQRGFFIIGTPDIGAAEFEGVDPFLDSDGDGFSDILERALGTNPDLADFDAAGRPQIETDANGDIALTFGRGSDFLPGTILLVERSTTLEAGSFEEVYRFDFDNATSTVVASDLSADEQEGGFLITDQSAFEKAFYRLSVTLSQ